MKQQDKRVTGSDATIKKSSVFFVQIFAPVNKYCKLKDKYCIELFVNYF